LIKHQILDLVVITSRIVTEVVLTVAAVYCYYV